MFENKASDLEEFKRKYEGAKPNLEKIKTLFIDSEVPVDLIEAWEKAAFDSNVLVDISPVSLRPDSGDVWDAIAFQLTVAGSFPDFLKFLEKIETNLYLTKINNLIVRRLSENNLASEKFSQFSLGDVNATLTVKVFIK